MDNHLMTLLLKTLSSIGYEDDKQLFAKKFMWVCEKQALDVVVGKLPKNQLSAIYGALNEKVLSDQSKTYLTIVLQSKSYQDALFVVLQQNLEDYMNTIAPTLSKEQMQRTERILTEYL